MASRHDWFGQQLAEFLAVVGSYLDEQSALDGAVEFIAIAVEAEVGAIVRDGEVTSCIGFRRGREPLEVLLAAAGDRPVTCDIPGLGPMGTVVTSISEDPETTLVIMRSGDEFDAEERTLLTGMCRVLRLALRPLRALSRERTLRHESQQAAEENRRLLRELQERQRFLERLSDIERAISERQPIQKVFDAIAQGAAEVLGQDVAVLRVVDADDPGYATIVATVGRDPATVEPIRRTPVTVSIGGQAIMDDELVACDDYAAAPRHHPAVLRDGICSAMAAPVHRDGTVAGSLVVGNRTPQHYTSAQQETLRAFAGHVSLALNDASAQEAMRRAYAEALHRATHDPLTGLPNRAAVTDTLDQALRRNVPGQVAVLFVDIDRFKSVNDSYGHAIGDQVLIAVAARLRGVVPPSDTVSRLAGDEFVVVCEGSGQDDTVLAERINDAIAEPMRVGGREVVVTSSVGVTRADGSRSAEEVLRDADLAMYLAKQRGRARIEQFDKVMRVRSLQRLETEQALRQAVKSEDWTVHYQPIVDTSTGRPLAVEALVRWDRQGVGMVPPNHFIPIAEEAGLIVPIGRSVLAQACRQIAAWRARGGLLADLRLSVNLSARQFNDPSLEADIVTALNGAGLPGEALGLEITETVLMDDAEATERTLHALRDLGVRLAIDDFGTGYSSLSYLKRFPVGELKIDRTFVDGLGRDAEDDAIVRAVVGLAHALGLDVTAEGVETADQLRLLDELGCGAAQGFLLGRPMPAEEAGTALADLGVRPWPGLTVAG